MYLLWTIRAIRTINNHFALPYCCSDSQTVRPSDRQTDNRSSRVRVGNQFRLAKGSRRFELLLLPLCSWGLSLGAASARQPRQRADHSSPHFSPCLCLTLANP